MARDVAAPEITEGATSGFPILVAITDDALCDPVVKTAEALAARHGASPSMLYVMDVLPYVGLDGGFGTAFMTEELLSPATRTADEAALRAACRVDVGAPATWPLEIELGAPASAIVARAKRLGAKLIVMGLHQHGRLDRAIGGDTLLETMALGGTPVLAVRPELTALPKSVVAAVDFSRASLRAARFARLIMDERATMRLVFVTPPAVGTPSESEEGRRLIETAGVDVAFSQVIQTLEPGPGMTILPVRRSGIPADELRAVCQEVNPDLLVIGSQRHKWLERLVVGSVASAMVRDGRWSVLVTPPAARPEEGSLPGHP